MPKSFSFPNPNDRTPSDSTVVVRQKLVLTLYNSRHYDRMEIRVNKKVRDWYVAEALSCGWHEAAFQGNACTLKINISHPQPSQ